MADTLRRLAKAGGWKVARRLIKPIPYAGTLLALGSAGWEIRRKGLAPGLLQIGLDALPVVGTVKGLIELFTGDLIPNRPGQDDTKVVPSDVPTETK